MARSQSSQFQTSLLYSVVLLLETTWSVWGIFLGRLKENRLMKAYATFRRPPLSEVVRRSNQDSHHQEVVPYGNFGRAVWPGHPVEFGVLMDSLIVRSSGTPAWRGLLVPTR